MKYRHEYIYYYPHKHKTSHLNTILSLKQPLNGLRQSFYFANPFILDKFSVSIATHMNKYIIELLKIESTVIIPEFGALMKTGKSLIFNPILKFNDGKLQQYIVEQVGKDEQEVGNMISKHVREIIAEIGKGNTYTVFGLGSFHKNEEGKIVFEAEDITKSTPVPTDTPTKPIEKIEPVKAEPKVEEKKAVVKDNSLSEKIAASVSSISPSETTKTKEESPAPIPVVKKEIPSDVRKVTPKKEEKAKKKKPWFLIILIVLLLLIGGAVGIFWSKISALLNDAKEEINTSINNKEIKSLIEDGINENEETDESEEMIYSDTTENDEDEIYTDDDSEEESFDETVENTNDNETVEDITPVISDDLIYHITVGSFGNKENANALVKRLQADGFTDARIIASAGSLHKVVAGSYASTNDAKKDIEKAKKYNPEAYVIKIK